MTETYANGPWVILGLLVYMGLLLRIGYWASKRVADEADFLVAGRRLGVPLMIGALVATWYGAGTTMGAAGMTYLFGIQGVIFDPFGAALCLLLLGLVFARLVRRSRFMTLVDYFESRYDRKVAGLGALVMLSAEMGWIGALLVGFGAIIQFFTGIPIAWGIGLSTLVLVAYTYLGGMYAVTLTDALQMSIITVSMIAILVIIMGQPEVGGWDYIFANSPASNWMGINQWDFLPTPASHADPELQNAGFYYYTGHMGWFYWAAAILSIGVGSIAAQDVNQRLMSARSENASVVSACASSVVYLVIGMIPVILGMAAYKLYPDLSLADVQGKLLLVMAADYLPLAIVIIFACGLVAALMSSAAAATLAGAAIIGYNGSKFVRPGISETQSLKLTRLFVPAVAGVSLILALCFETIYNLMVASWTLLLVSMFVPYAAGFFWKRANAWGALASMAGGFLGWLAGYFAYLPLTSAANTGVYPGVEGVYFEWAHWDALYISSIWGLISSVVLMVAVSLATARIAPPKPLCDADGNLLDTRGWFGLSFGKSRGAYSRA
ncbi:hypothetical protein [Mangrovicoccus sp. HB161399]|uniref:sodium:solute symporter family transporter n=1 Tax=Mangrovicoccus sp. HB161399 TaxID=2720392 RepID=UPI0015559810|nr:hypothetical protein [Mangrovicoccus sp. HB161399]